VDVVKNTQCWAKSGGVKNT